MSISLRVVYPPSSDPCAELEQDESPHVHVGPQPIVRRILYFIIRGEPWRYICNAWSREDADRLGLTTMPAPDNPDLRLESWEENLITGEVVKPISISELEAHCRKQRPSSPLPLSLQTPSRH